MIRHQILYSPYNFFIWCKIKHYIPENSFLVCGQPTDNATCETSDFFFLIDANKTIDEQMAQIVTLVGAYNVQYHGSDTPSFVASLVSSYASEWLLKKTTTYIALDDSPLILSDDLMHPIAIMIQTMTQMGLFATDILFHINSGSPQTSDWLLCGFDTHEQVASLKRCIARLYSQQTCDDIATASSKLWQSLQTRYNNKYGFCLLEYNFHTQWHQKNNTTV